MAARKQIQIVGKNFLHFWIPINPKPNKSRLLTLLILADHIDDYLKIQRENTEGSRELFLPENDFKTCSTVNVPNKHPDSEGLETKQRQETQTWIFFTCHSTYEFKTI